MNLPIYGYGKSVLKQKAKDITPDYPNLKELINHMWETMENASGCGLAAPQIGKSVRLFVADSKLICNEMEIERRNKYFDDDDKGIRGVFINPELIAVGETYWEDIEGCLSLPSLSGRVERPWKITMRYQNENFETFEKDFTGMTARVLLHEYDHIEGILYVDKVKPFSKRLMESKLKKLQKGKINAPYPIKFN